VKLIFQKKYVLNWFPAVNNWTILVFKKQRKVQKNQKIKLYKI